MAKNKPDPSPELELDKESRKRLEKLSAQWDELPNAWSLVNITLPDLRLLLEHHAPLQDLIRTLVAVPTGTSPAALAQETSQLRSQLEDEQSQHQHTQAELDRAQAELEQHSSKIRQLQADLGQCSAAVQKLTQDKSKIEQQLQQTQHALQSSQAQLARSGSTPAELALLRSDPDLARGLSLPPLESNDTQALIQIVAVLAQMDNIKRLWQVLKERCEAQQRPANANERQLLATALAWHNNNWLTRPYKLVEICAGQAYDYDQHQRCRLTHQGETIAAQYLPGIADSSGKLQCKVLVSTH